MEARQALRDIAPDLAPRAALFASSDLVAFGALTEAQALGITVPERLAICGFGDFELSRGSAPAITTAQVDGDEMGRQAARLLLERMAGGSPDIGDRILVPYRIIARQST